MNPNVRLLRLLRPAKWRGSLLCHVAPATGVASTTPNPAVGPKPSASMTMAYIKTASSRLACNTDIVTENLKNYKFFPAKVRTLRKRLIPSNVQELHRRARSSFSQYAKRVGNRPIQRIVRFRRYGNRLGASAFRALKRPARNAIGFTDLVQLLHFFGFETPHTA